LRDGALPADIKSAATTGFFCSRDLYGHANDTLTGAQYGKDRRHEVCGYAMFGFRRHEIPRGSFGPAATTEDLTIRKNFITITAAGKTTRKFYMKRQSAISQKDQRDGQ